MVSSVTPAGTITQTARGAASFSASSVRVATSLTSGLWSKPTTSWPAARNRSRMLPPMRPRPTRPSCICLSSVSGWSDQRVTRIGMIR